MRFLFKIIGIVLGVVVLVLALPLWLYFPRHNFRTVEEGAFYRSRQMSGKALEAAVEKYGIQTVINLRGASPGAPWYDEEVAACSKLNVALENFDWSMRKLPDPESLARFVALIEAGGKPFLAHCEGGTHRAGVAAACYTLLTGADAATARKQFGPMFDDAPIGKLIDLYEGSGLPFNRWALEEYPALYSSLDTSRAISPASGIAVRLSTASVAQPAPCSTVVSPAFR
jgi:protein tyrosine phosphatase (PTP) superfamily phosphohydrolase (DUF442 family)